MLPLSLRSFYAILSLLFCVFAQGYSLGYYKVVGPNEVRPNSEYHVSVSTAGTSQITFVTVSIGGQSHTGRNVSVYERLQVQPYSTNIAKLEIGNLDPGSYKLNVKGDGGVDFQSQALLNYAKNSYVVFVQTDKAVYKPEQTILFRVIVLNPNLKLINEITNEPIQVYITDGQGNKVKEWNNIIIPKGVFSGELSLSNAPVLGTWTIWVKTHEQTYNKNIEVALYVMPKFVVKIDAPKHVTFQQNIITTEINTRYNYGRKVKGDATITIYPTIYSGVLQPFINLVRKVIKIDGEATINFDIDKELNLNDEYERTVVIDVAIEEALTGRIQNNSVEVHIHKYDYKMELIKTADYYKPGLKYTVYIKVSNYDGTPLRKDQNSVKVKYGYSRVDEVYMEKILNLDEYGVTKLELYPPIQSTNTTALRVEAEYLDLKERLPPVPAAVSPSNTFIQASLATTRAVVGLNTEIFVNCTEPMKYISYELVGRGDVLKANTYQIYNLKTYTFRFEANFAMVPISHLLVSFLKENGEVVSDSLEIETEERQTVNDIKLSTDETQPEYDVHLTITTNPFSYVGLLAVDENVNKLRPEYDITSSDVFSEMRRFGGAKMSPYSTILRKGSSHFFWQPGSTNTKDIFSDSGAVLITNGYVSNYRPTLEDVYLRPVSYGSSTVKPDLGFGLSFKPATRPPNDGPFAFSRIPTPVWNKPRVFLSEALQDTWLFANSSSDSEGKAVLRKKVPNSVTNWLISGFSLDPLHGFRLMQNSKLLKVSKELYITLDLPHSVQREEILAIPVVVHNRLNRDISVDVMLHNTEQKFDFSEVSNEVNATKKIELSRRKRVTVGKFSEAPVSFMIKPTKLGLTDIKITATYSNLQDIITKKLRVEAEGETEYYSRSILIDLRKKPNYSGNITIQLPRNLVEDSEKIEISTVSDLLGPLIINMDNLVRLPTGCGEQNLIHFVPDLIVLNYLKNTGQLSPTIEMEARKNLEISYQKQLGYKRSDGSFSTFGKENEAGSIWITAYTILSFIQAKPYVYIDDSIITKGLEWLAEHQALNGSFVETSPIIYNDLQRNDNNAVALTAFTLTVFLENRKKSSQYTNLISKGLDYVARNSDEDDSIYGTALTSYVLQIANHPSWRQALNHLDLKAKTGNNLKWWGKDVSKNEASNPWNSLPKSVDIETTSYALLAFLEADLIDDAIPIVNWLVNQSNNLGGFASTQDTRMSLLALYRLVLRLSIESNMQINYQYRKQESRKFNINKNNAMIVQKEQLGNEARVINITAEGRGIALVKVSYQYNKNVTGPWPMFTLDPQVDKNSNQHHLQLSICTGFVSRNLTDNTASNMAVMEVNLPSGFTADMDSLPSLEVSQDVQKVETKNGDTAVVLYFYNLTREEYCPTVSAYRTHKVAKQKPVSVLMYDYYDSSRRARVFYGSRTTATLCDICEDEDCGDICIESEPVLGPLNSTSVIYPATITMTTVVIAYILN